jgi:hypothetical protein
MCGPDVNAGVIPNECLIKSHVPLIRASTAHNLILFMANLKEVSPRNATVYIEKAPNRPERYLVCKPTLY